MCSLGARRVGPWAPGVRRGAAACAARPFCPPALPGLGRGLGRVHPLPAPNASSPRSAARDGGSGYRNARPLGAHRAGVRPRARGLGPACRWLAHPLPSLSSSFRRHPAAWARARGFRCSSLHTSGVRGGAGDSPPSPASLPHFPVIKTVVENRSSLFPRPAAIFPTLRALLGRRIQCFGVYHSGGIKLFSS